MKRRLFEDLVVSAAGGRRARAGLGWPVSLTLHAVGVAVLMALPALTTEALPDPPARPLNVPVVVLPAPAPQTVAPVAPPRPAGGGQRRPATVITTRRMEAVPQTVPDLPPAPESDEVLAVDPPGNVGFCVGNCASPGTGGPPGDGTMPGDGGPGTGTGLVRVGGVIKPPTKIRDARPVYPPLAQQARLQGRVVLECIISTDGRVEQVQIVSGPPLLQDAAVDAVRQWRYTPTFLNGAPVSVIMTVTLIFTLN
jgi:periplasmic protein TonB